MAGPGSPAPTWKRVVAPNLDFTTVFFGVGYVIAATTNRPQHAR